LNAEVLLLAVLFLLVPAEHLGREHSFLLGFGKYSVAADVLISVVREPVPMDGLDNVVILVLGNEQSGLLWLWFAWFLSFGDLGKVVFPLIVSLFYLLPLKLGRKTCLELFKQLQFHSLLNLGHDLSAKHEEVVGWTCSCSGLYLLSSATDLLVRADGSFDCVSKVSVCEVSHCLCCEQRVDDLGGLNSECFPHNEWL
jgi:hypothetical protein